MRDTVLGEIETLLENQPLLDKKEVDSGIKVYGNYKICNQLKNEVFEDCFAIEIIIPDGFPDAIPTVKTVDGRIRASNYNGHIYPNGQFCLEIDTAIADFMQDNQSLLDFLSRYLDTYLCGFLFYTKYKRMPFGERRHGFIGMMDYYCEVFEVGDIKPAFSLLVCLFSDNLKGHIQCPCQSGKRYRDCHRERIHKLKTSGLYERYKHDYIKIIDELAKQITR